MAWDKKLVQTPEETVGLGASNSYFETDGGFGAPDGHAKPAIGGHATRRRRAGTATDRIMRMAALALETLTDEPATLPKTD